MVIKWKHTCISTFRGERYYLRFKWNMIRRLQSLFETGLFLCDTLGIGLMTLQLETCLLPHISQHCHLLLQHLIVFYGYFNLENLNLITVSSCQIHSSAHFLQYVYTWAIYMQTKIQRSYFNQTDKIKWIHSNTIS